MYSRLTVALFAARHPGEETDNPERAVVFTVSGEIVPGGRLPFTYRPDAPLPERRDGRFEASISVVALAGPDREHGWPVPSRPSRGSGGQD